MDRLLILAQDKVTLADLREYFKKTLEGKVVALVMSKKDPKGYAEANEIIKVALDELEAMVKVKKKPEPNQSI